MLWVVVAFLSSCFLTARLMRSKALKLFTRKCLFLLQYRRKAIRALDDEENAWYTQKKPILWAYAGGGATRRYSNSREAIEESIRRGFSVVEVDVSLTKDGIPVLSHWFRPDNQIMFEKDPSYGEFKATLIDGKFHALSLDELIEAYPDPPVYFSIDPAFLVSTRSGFDLVSYLMKRSPLSFLKKVIYQVYSLSELKRIQTLSPDFASLHFVLEVLNNSYNNYWKVPYLLPFLTEAGVRSVSLRDRRISEELRETIKYFVDANIRVLVTGVDYKDRAVKLLRLGISGFNTHFMEPALFQNDGN